jgi:hypothetical protein
LHCCTADGEVLDAFELKGRFDGEGGYAVAGAISERELRDIAKEDAFFADLYRQRPGELVEAGENDDDNAAAAASAAAAAGAGVGGVAGTGVSATAVAADAARWANLDCSAPARPDELLAVLTRLYPLMRAQETLTQALRRAATAYADAKATVAAVKIRLAAATTAVAGGTAAPAPAAPVAKKKNVRRAVLEAEERVRAEAALAAAAALAATSGGLEGAREAVEREAAAAAETASARRAEFDAVSEAVDLLTASERGAPVGGRTKEELEAVAARLSQAVAAHR